MKRLGLALLTMVALVADCDSQRVPVGPAGPAPASGHAYRLYTHCGIRWAKIAGTFWRATPPLSDGNGNPPPGWGNPFQPGTLTMTSSTTATFTSQAGSARFKRTSWVNPPTLCD